VLAAGNFSITATLLNSVRARAADTSRTWRSSTTPGASKPTRVQGTAASSRDPRCGTRAATSKPVDQLGGIRERAGRRSATGRTAACACTRAHAVLRALGRSGVGADNERLVIRHDAGSSAAPYVAGTLLAIRRVAEKPGLQRGLDTLMD